MLSLTNKLFGNAGQGQDDTAAINAWLAAADATKQKAYAPAGTYLHTGFSIPRDVVLEGESKEHTIFKMMDGANSINNISLEGPKTNLLNFTVDGNKSNGNLGDGIVTTAGGSWFSSFEQINVKQVEGISLDVQLMNNGSIRNFSSDRCGTALRIKSSIGLTLDSLDLSRCKQYGLWILGNPTMALYNITNLYMEAGTAAVDVPDVGASFIRLESLRNEHVVNISGVYMNGHMDLPNQITAGIEVVGPLSMHNAKISKVLMHKVYNSFTTSGVVTNEKSLLKIDDVTYHNGTLPILPQDGIILTSNIFV